jgi:hypothetical protein
MIAITKEPPQTFPAEQNEKFLDMLPLIRRQARLAFRRLHPELKEELVQEVIANAFCRFSRLVRSDKANLAYATPLANFAIRQTLAGRRVGTKFNVRDLTSPHRRSACRIIVERLDRFDRKKDEWREVLVEDRRATPADVAAWRIDLTAWFGSLPRRQWRIAKALAMGETTSEAARRFGVSLARISQFRGELRANWEEFQGGGDSCVGQGPAAET